MRRDWLCLLWGCCLSVSSTTNRDSLLFIWTPAHTFDLSKWVANPSQSYCGAPWLHFQQCCLPVDLLVNSTYFIHFLHQGLMTELLSTERNVVKGHLERQRRWHKDPSGMKSMAVKTLILYGGIACNQPVITSVTACQGDCIGSNSSR